jgi:membrane-associated phospholipid phosphatase
VLALLAFVRSPLDRVLAATVRRVADANNDEWVTKLGSVEALTVVALIAAAVLVWHGHRRQAATVAASVAGAVAISWTTKLLLHREKPVVAGDDAALRIEAPSADVVVTAACLVAALAIVAIVARRASRRRGTLSNVALALLCAAPLAVDETVKRIITAANTGNAASFPSAHALNTASLAVAVALAAWPTRWRLPVALVALLVVVAVAVTRVSLSVHHPTDVLAGAMLGAAWTATLTLIVLRHRGRTRQHGVG